MKAIRSDQQKKVSSPCSPKKKVKTSATKKSTSLPLSAASSTLTPTNIRLDLTVTEPPTPLIPPTLSPPPPRYPETLGTLVQPRLSDPMNPSRGLGLFALMDIPPGSLILFELPLVIIPHTITETRPPFASTNGIDPLDAVVENMEKEKRVRFLELCGYKRRVCESMNRAVVYSNGFEAMGGEATAIFDVVSRINHSCVPNCKFVFKPSEWEGKEEGAEGRMMVYNTFKLMEGEEITVDYGHSRKGLKSWYGFECECGVCGDEDTASESESDSEGEESSEQESEDREEQAKC